FFCIVLYSVILGLLRQWKSTRWHLRRKKSAKSSALGSKVLFYFIVRLTGYGSNFGGDFCLLLTFAR
ncbi:hypothetical protein, partial [uncultured Gemmiger sp.]|uniref:hypothetical protein n=1 Tax=uncultured Gemmiger sp. TaxID=1623490 RepID=UPI0025E92044